MRNEMVTVLDLGSTKVAGLLASLGENDDLKVHGAAIEGCWGVRRGVVTDLEETSRAIEVVLRKLREKTGHESSGVVVGVTGAHIEGMNAQGYVPIYPKSRSITREDVLQVIKHSRQVVLPPDREQIMAIPREFKVDGPRGVQRPVGMIGSMLEVITYVVTGQTTHIQNIEKAISMTGKRVDNMVLEALASGLGVLTQEEMELGTAVADIGGGSTDLAIFTGGSISYSGVTPVGGALVTSDLSKLLKTSPEEAERLKMLHASAVASMARDGDSVEVMQIGQDHTRPMQRKVLCEIVESRMREIAVMIRSQIEGSGLGDLLPGGLVLTGGGAMMQGVEELFSDVLKYTRVRVSEPEVPEYAFNGHSFATAVGMARFAIEGGDDELVPAVGAGGWKDHIRTIWSLIKK